MRAETVRLEIETVVAGGDGLARFGQRAAFVPLTAPGDIVEAEIISEKKSYVRAALRGIVKPSPSRIKPECPYYSQCGGCNLQHISYESQIAIKETILTNALSRFSIPADSLDLHILIEPSRPFSYRNRMRFGFTHDCVPGLSERSSNDIVRIDSCPIAVPEINKSLSGFTDGRYQSHLFAESGTVTIFGTSERAYIEKIDSECAADILGRTFRFAPSGFFQSNVSALEGFIPRVTAGLGGERAADLFSGVGLFSAFLSDSFKKISLVETSAFSLAYAERNVPQGTCDFFTSPAEEWAAAGKLGRFDCVFMDPPRTGLPERLRKALTREKVPVIEYVSCDPVTFARDLSDLVSSGYIIIDIGGWDFFPQTSHFESFARLLYEGNA